LAFYLRARQVESRRCGNLIPMAVSDRLGGGFSGIVAPFFEINATLLGGLTLYWRFHGHCEIILAYSRIIPDVLKSSSLIPFTNVNVCSRNRLERKTSANVGP
jgi:hypothetical protein